MNKPPPADTPSAVPVARGATQDECDFLRAKVIEVEADILVLRRKGQVASIHHLHKLHRQLSDDLRTAKENRLDPIQAMDDATLLQAIMDTILHLPPSLVDQVSEMVAGISDGSVVALKTESG